jgi:hypothetical protein
MVGSTPVQLAAALDAERARMANAAKQANLQPE